MRCRAVNVYLIWSYFGIYAYLNDISLKLYSRPGNWRCLGLNKGLEGKHRNTEQKASSIVSCMWLIIRWNRSLFVIVHWNCSCERWVATHSTQVNASYLKLAWGCSLLYRICLLGVNSLWYCHLLWRLRISFFQVTNVGV